MTIFFINRSPFSHEIKPSSYEQLVDESLGEQLITKKF